MLILHLEDASQETAQTLSCYDIEKCSLLIKRLASFKMLRITTPKKTDLTQDTIHRSCGKVFTIQT